MSGILLVPIYLDALWLKRELSVVEPKVDFTCLPYRDGTRDVNPDVANLSEEVIARPFHDKGLQLKAGVHLHWALPEALTRGISQATNRHAKKHKVAFPAVPNRWLVSRSRTDWQKPDQQWMVESDYLHPAALGHIGGAVAIPFPAPEGHPPFRYLGRKKLLKADEWTEENAESLAAKGYQLTAIGYEPQPNADAEKKGGYGEPTFATFYPNCHSIFGLHDPLPPSSLKGVRYEVIGWFSDASMDCLFPSRLQHVLSAVKARMPNATQAERNGAALKEAFGWEALAGDGLPERMVCYARLEFDEAEPPSPSLPKRKVSVAVGNTSTEALSAYLAGGKLELEEQLEALHLSSRIEGKQLDIGVRFRQARHEKGFAPVSGGTLWSIRPKSKDQTAAAADAAGLVANESLPVELAQMLNEVNLRQTAYDSATEELVSTQRQLFADWYKYILCVHPPHETRDDYPDADKVQHFVTKSVLQVKRETARLNALNFQFWHAYNALARALDLFQQSAKNTYTLERSPAPRYWRPHEPVVLIVDESVKASQRHGQTGRVPAGGIVNCQIMPSREAPIHKALPSIREAITKHQNAHQGDGIGFNQWKTQPWNPFALEWRAELFPLEEENNLKSSGRNYSPKFITTNYGWTEDGVDLKPRAARVAVQRANSVYIGSSLLTPHARRQLQTAIEAFLEKSAAPQGQPDSAIVSSMKRIRAFLNSKDFHAMAQKLNGFNDALLMLKATLQLPIADPLGFEDSKEFTKSLCHAVDNQNRSAPQPSDDFHPIRSGVLKISDLRLIDTFGRTQSLSVKDDSVIVAESLRAPGAPHLVSLPPRIVQPARLNFRWLSGNPGNSLGVNEVEVNAHPATTPICGWLLLNDLDDSLMVYDAAGAPLCSIAGGRWMKAPGAPSITVGKIPNLHLRTLALHLTELDEKSFEIFLDNVEAALEYIDPEGYAQNDALALLIGRPMAVVRATLDLQLRGLPAINQDWNVFRHDLERDLQSELTPGSKPAPRHTDGFTQVQFPIRLGNYRLLNDGLICYWTETRSAEGKTYDYNQPARFVGSSSAEDVVLTVDDPVAKLTMLIDPRGSVHARSGILPTKAIDIPGDQFDAALKQIAVTFLCAPILSAQAALRVPVPGEPGYTWSWLGPEETVSKDITPITGEADLDGTQEILEGWLQLKKLQEKVQK